MAISCLPSTLVRANWTDSKTAMTGWTLATYRTKLNIHSLTGESAPRNDFTDITEKPEHGGLPNTTSAETRDQSFGSHASADQFLPSKCRFASQLATPNPPGNSRLPTRLKPACTIPSVNPPAKPRTSTDRKSTRLNSSHGYNS